MTKQGQKPKVTEREVRMARAFLAAIGGNQSNGYLLLAVIAWARAMRRGHDSFWRGLRRFTPQQAGARLAAHLRARLSGRQERGVLRALRDRSASAGQGQLFLTRLARSDYDRHHYGFVAHKDSYMETKVTWIYDGGGAPRKHTEYIWHAEVVGQNPLVDSWRTLFGAHMKKSWFADTIVKTTPARTVVKRYPPQPRSLMHVQPKPDYIQPYAARIFYEARAHTDAYILPQD